MMIRKGKTWEEGNHDVTLYTVGGRRMRNLFVTAVKIRSFLFFFFFSLFNNT